MAKIIFNPIFNKVAQEKFRITSSIVDGYGTYDAFKIPTFSVLAVHHVLW